MDMHRDDMGVVDWKTSSIRDLIAILRKHALVITVVTAIVVAAIVSWTFAQQKIFRATATIQVDLEAPRVLGRQIEDVEELDEKYYNSGEYLATQHEVARSEQVARQVVETLHLDSHPSVGAVAKASPDGRPGIETVSAFVRQKLTVKPVRDTRLFTISADDPDPQMAEKLANAAAQAYLRQNVDRRLESTAQAVRWLAEQREELRRELERSETELYKFREQNSILSIPIEDQQNIALGRIRTLSEALTNANIETIHLATRREQLSTMDLSNPLSPSLDLSTEDKAMSSSKERFLELNRELARLKSRYGDSHPRVHDLMAELQRLQDDMQQGATKLLEALESELRSARQNEKALQQALAEAQAEAIRLNQHEIRNNQLRRERNNNEKLFELVLARAKETDLARLLRVNNVRVLDKARVPTHPHSPRVVLNILVGLFLGLLGGIGVAFLIEVFDVSIRGLQDIEHLTNTLGFFPCLEDDKGKRLFRWRRRQHRLLSPDRDMWVFKRPKSPAAESMRTVRTNLLFTSPEKRLQTILVTSHGPLEGKTTVALNLAIAMAQNGNHVVLIDTDMRKPRLHKSLGLPSSKGISSVIIGECGIGEVAQETIVPNLTFIASGPVPPNPAELLQTQRFRAVMDELRTRYQLAVFDSPPVGAVSDAMLLATGCDGTVLVLRDRFTRKDAFEHTVRQLRAINATIVGAVLNNVVPGPHGYGYGYGYGYYYRRYGTYAYGYYGDSDQTVSDGNGSTGSKVVSATTTSFPPQDLV